MQLVPMFRAAQALLGSPQCADCLVSSDCDRQGLSCVLKAIRWILEKRRKCFGQNVIRTDGRPHQNVFYLTRIVGLTSRCPSTPSRIPRKEGLLDLSVHDVEDSLEAVPFRQERVL